MADSSSLPQPPQRDKTSKHDVMIQAALSAYIVLLMGREVTSREECQAGWGALHAAIDAFAARAPSSPPPPAPGENAEGLSVICRKCGSLVSGVEAGNRVRWVVCQKCTPPPPATRSEGEDLDVTWLLNSWASIKQMLTDVGLRLAPEQIEYDDKIMRRIVARLSGLEPPQTATPSPEAIEAACRATGAQIIDPEDELALQEVRDMPKVLRAAYAAQFGVQSRPEAKHQEGR